MTHDWTNPAGAEPDDADDPLGGWLRPTGWQWDAQSLSMGEYVGFELYLLLRDRFCSLGLPMESHDLLIQEMIDTHDVGLYTDGRAKVTMWYNSSKPGAVVDIHVEGGDCCPDLDDS
jgi:hypothetical protein